LCCSLSRPRRRFANRCIVNPRRPLHCRARTTATTPRAGRGAERFPRCYPKWCIVVAAAPVRTAEPAGGDGLSVLPASLLAPKSSGRQKCPSSASRGGTRRPAVSVATPRHRSCESPNPGLRAPQGSTNLHRNSPTRALP
jgi:hypothetical protein